MQEYFQAFRIHAEEKFEHAGIETLHINDLSAGDVLIEVHYSSVNYKDALAGSGQGKILRKSPLNGGIDCAGVVVESEDSALPVGQQVLVNGCGLSEVHDGGYSQYVRVPAKWVIVMPEGLDMRTAMIIGTAGFTAALAIQRLLDNHQRPEQGPILVTGATGGVGSFAIRLLSQLGFEVAAMTRQTQAHEYLESLGADHIVSPDCLSDDGAPMHKGRWSGAIDNLGGQALAALTKSVKPWGNIVSVGMAAGTDIKTSTMPFILRGISVLGVSSANCPQHWRQAIWTKLGATWHPDNIEMILADEIGLEQLPHTFEELLNANTQGRYLVKII